MLNNSWRDSAWSNVKLVRNGIDGDVKESRELVFGKNMIDIRQKTVPQLLIDEVSHCSKVLIRANSSEAFHPFYVFQIASLVLWAADNYFYYATCILIISVVSITTTLIETRAVSGGHLILVQVLTITDYEASQRTFQIRV